MSSRRNSWRACICAAKSIRPRSPARVPLSTSRRWLRRSSTSVRKCSLSLISSTVKRAPWSFSARMRPPWSSTISRARARPMPVPPCRRVSPMSTWKKRSKSRSAISGGKPGPSSFTTIQAVTPRSCSETVTCPPSGVNLRALESRFTKTRSIRSRSQCTKQVLVARSLSSMRLRCASGCTCSHKLRRCSTRSCSPTFRRSRDSSSLESRSS